MPTCIGYGLGFGSQLAHQALGHIFPLVFALKIPLARADSDRYGDSKDKSDKTRERIAP